MHTGLFGHDAKRIHFIHYIVNLRKQNIASIDERLAIYIDMTTRRSATFEPDIIESLDKAVERFAGLGWKPELSGAIKLKNHQLSSL